MEKNPTTPRPHDPTTTKNKIFRPVWKFTNKKELNKNEFINYVERKVFRTIRKHNILPKNKIFTIKKSNDLNTAVLKQILQTKFQVKLIPNAYRLKPNASSDNLSQITEDIFKQILKGNFSYSLPSNSCHLFNTPLLYLSDKEVNLYVKLKKIKGTKRKQNKKIQSLFNKFLIKNPDLELNILKASQKLRDKKN